VLSANPEQCPKGRCSYPDQRSAAMFCDVCEHYYWMKKILEEVLKRGKEGLSKDAELEVLKLKVA